MSTLGFSGQLARRFMNSRLTPLLALVALLLGVFATLITPREEEPQIDVTMADLIVPFPGASASDVEQQVVRPLEALLGETPGVDHIYSASRPGMAVITLQFKVGVPRTEALVRLYHTVYSNQDWHPAGLGVGQVMVKPKGIDDVPVVALTLHTKDPTLGAYDLGLIASALESELKQIPATRNIEISGAPEQVVEVRLSPEKLAQYNLSLTALKQALMAANLATQAGALVVDNQYQPVQAGRFLMTAEDVQQLIVGSFENSPVYLAEVAQVVQSPQESSNYVWYRDKQQHTAPAVTLSVSKKSGENAVKVAAAVLDRVKALKGYLIPDNVEVSVTRNYGETANEKANKLIHKLEFATLSVIVLVLFALGRREAVVVGSAVVLTLLATLFASWAWGFTLNRVSLFALIFSIGILVDDAIVVVENIHRHLAKGQVTLREAIPLAVDEVGGPTILATLTVIAALLPMAFVTGLMGPYMSPIPINASMGMLLSLIIAFTFTPWLAAKMYARTNLAAAGEHNEHSPDRLHRFFAWLFKPFLGRGRYRRNRYLLGLLMLVLIALALALGVTQQVVLKMLPFDNKSEFQVVLEMPEGTALETTNRVLAELSDYLLTVEEVENIQGYAGTASPVGFNGLVRQYYLRSEPHQGDLQVNLKPKSQRNRSSHAIALAVRPALEQIGRDNGALVKLAEVPPGPPVLSPVVAEIYGPDYAGQMAKAAEVAEALRQSPQVVEVDTSMAAAPASRWVLEIDRSRAAVLGLSQAEIAGALATLVGGEDITYLQTGRSMRPVPLRLTLPVSGKSWPSQLLDIKLQTASGQWIALADVVQIKQQPWEQTIFHKDHRRVVYVTADVAGGLDSPLYGMFHASGKLDHWPQWFISAPEDQQAYALKWDGEWRITYETFRDMGAAYSVGLILIYLLVVAQFGSYRVPLVIMAPIPLTLIGIMPGHALLGAQFTATSMIGMIALAGIIVRNSILLVDFVNQQLAKGVVLEDAVLQAAAVRAKPIVLTAVAAMMGAFFILDDPIFNGLAISLIFGLAVSTLLTLLVIPLLYYGLQRRVLAKKSV